MGKGVNLDFNRTTELLTISIASKTMYASGIASGVAWLASLDWIGVVGTILAVVGFITNLYFRNKKDKREQAEHERKMHRMDLENQLKYNEIKRSRYDGN